ncbi:MAG TPA: tRNA (adenosine(37)-N6)-threonylcarbamoyltransferase complex dimerization subunit type 1 TsaB [Candidatus Binataceae bacterium]|nr:tRNA (adenosine(37)-N6)-threonylcarbamoyltransferase complex dimerization subunit type 1 TsaB [Candidatus Binataceae bacterium]
MTSRVLSAERISQAAAAVGPVLGIETGGPVISLGVVNGGRIKASFARELPSHCAGLPIAIDEVLGAAGFRLPDLVGVAIGIGPGSFTGLRVGLSYAKGLARGLGIVIVGVPSLDAIVLSEPLTPRPGATVCPVLDARRGEVYGALYRFSGDALQKVVDEFAVSAAELAEMLDGEVIFSGDAARQEVCRLAAIRGVNAIVSGAGELYLRGSAVAGIGAARIAEHEADEAATLEPLYVRPSGAVRASILGERNYGTPGRGIDPAPRGS